MHSSSLEHVCTIKAYVCTVQAYWLLLCLDIADLTVFDGQTSHAGSPASQQGSNALPSICLTLNAFPGQRQNNTTQQRADSNRLKGYRFFADDEDHFGLEDILQAVMFMKSSQAFVPAKPWQLGLMSKTVHAVEDLSDEAQSHLRQMMSGV